MNTLNHLYLAVGNLKFFKMLINLVQVNLTFLREPYSTSSSKFAQFGSMSNYLVHDSVYDSLLSLEHPKVCIICGAVETAWSTQKRRDISCPEYIPD